MTDGAITRVLVDGTLLPLGLAFAAGVLLGLVFYLGLWATLSRLGRVRHPALLVLASLLLRMTAAAAGLAVLARWGAWPAVLAALAGMLLVRLALLRRLGPPGPEATR